ncbi:uncharacterized protein BP01DRAFT_118036 [Aspergillus saccharolyticus JOP 1030-1]|uniref:Uncharacterized protein n=1 Tax=Aspergillus saccharolyticus JOP 1030-1 TaxID=1450539 RepID=A0A318ZXV0_9EURO|nr:hypothetical protein BP01DRAFT_118036 [Aspergillus saccharolyticus JOP 1030-1]PYH49000.1 hypothetical protein BP01DRAFT_118036 [Aspergillus saccharolyticus JOP 1030-1]
MGVSRLLVSSLLWVASTSATTEFSPNANHIFNTIHSSMRQWGSSLQHNGMSFFLATVPAGTQFYHGNSNPAPVNGTEWLAFEPEHALAFARPFRGSPPSHDDDKQDQRKKRAEAEEQESEGGWLHTYIAAKDLRLLYADGMSAGKTANGTLDAEDRILFQDNLPGEGAMHGERERAVEFCRMAREDFNGRLDGLLRMEAGFEIILCDFARDLKEVRVTQVKSHETSGSKDSSNGKGKGKGGPPGGGNDWMKAVTARYGGIGGHRVALNYETFVSAYTYGLDLFHSVNETFKLPRLMHLSSQELQPIRDDLHRLILDHAAKDNLYDWQAIADMVVERYAREIRYLASGDVATVEELHAEIETMLRPFIDYSDRDVDAERDRCAHQFIPGEIAVDSVAATAIHAVARSICSTMLSAWQEPEYQAAVGHFRELMNYLAWTTWKQCSGCGDHEVCVIPIWPTGTLEDYEHPQCRDYSNPASPGQGYWGNPRGPRPHDEPEEASGWLERFFSYLQVMLRTLLGMHF